MSNSTRVIFLLLPLMWFIQNDCNGQHYQYLNTQMRDSLSEIIQKNKIILIGESSHQVKEYDELKAEIITFCKTEHGIANTVFELNLLSTYCYNICSNSMTDEVKLNSIFYTLQQTHSNLNLLKTIDSLDIELLVLTFWNPMSLATTNNSMNAYLITQPTPTSCKTPMNQRIIEVSWIELDINMQNQDRQC